MTTAKTQQTRKTPQCEAQGRSEAVERFVEAAKKWGDEDPERSTAPLIKSFANHAIQNSLRSSAYVLTDLRYPIRPVNIVENTP